VLLNVDKVNAGYGSLVVLRDITFGLEKGETLAVIGPNGAGKTTLLWSLSGLIKPKGGKVTFDDADITGIDARKIVRLGIGHVLEGMRVFSTLSVEDNLVLGTYGAGGSAEESIATVYKWFPVLEKKRKQMAGSLSGGEKQMLAIGRTLMCELKLLLLDEPSAGLAPLLVRRLFDILKELRKEYGLTILLVEQNAEIALEFADRGMVLSHGEIMLEGDAKSLMNDKEVKRIYLGEGTTN
jgi:branched-chain amino acid transport system ATP-binding protein